MVEDQVENPDVHHEESDVNVRAILWVGVIFAVIGILVHLGAWVLFGTFRAYSERSDPADVSALPIVGDQRPEPRLQLAPVQEMQDYRTNEAARLDEYGWIDEEAGVVHIPIDLAIGIAAERELPVREDALGGPDDGSSGELPEDLETETQQGN